MCKGRKSWNSVELNRFWVVRSYIPWYKSGDQWEGSRHGLKPLCLLLKLCSCTAAFWLWLLNVFFMVKGLCPNRIWGQIQWYFGQLKWYFGQIQWYFGSIKCYLGQIHWHKNKYSGMFGSICGFLDIFTSIWGEYRRIWGLIWWYLGQIQWYIENFSSVWGKYSDIGGGGGKRGYVGQ